MSGDPVTKAADDLRDFVAQYAPSHVCGGEYDGRIEVKEDKLFGPQECGACRLVFDYDSERRASDIREDAMRRQNATSKCSGCGAEVGWVITKRGKRMPVDAESLTDEDVEILGRVGESLDYRHGDHTSHFGTCPKAGEFRR